MVGAIIFLVVMLLVLPVAIMFTGAIWSAGFGWLSSPGNVDADPAESAH